MKEEPLPDQYKRFMSYQYKHIMLNNYKHIMLREPYEMLKPHEGRYLRLKPGCRNYGPTRQRGQES
jgi:hypothetical protein